MTDLDPKTLPPRQRQVYRFLKSYAARKGTAPTIREIAAHLDVTSTNGVIDHLNALKSKGFVKHEVGKARAWVAR